MPHDNTYLAWWWYLLFTVGYTSVHGGVFVMVQVRLSHRTSWPIPNIWWYQWEHLGNGPKYGDQKQSVPHSEARNTHCNTVVPNHKSAFIYWCRYNMNISWWSYVQPASSRGSHTWNTGLCKYKGIQVMSVEVLTASSTGNHNRNQDHHLHSLLHTYTPPPPQRTSSM